jgi:hypothetical protein
VVVAAVDELLMLGADPPGVARLLAAGKDGEQLLAALDPVVALQRAGAGRHRRPL